MPPISKTKPCTKCEASFLPEAKNQDICNECLKEQKEAEEE